MGTTDQCHIFVRLRPQRRSASTLKTKDRHHTTSFALCQAGKRKFSANFVPSGFEAPSSLFFRMPPPISRVVWADLQAIYMTRLSGVFRQQLRAVRPAAERKSWERHRPTPTSATGAVPSAVNCPSPVRILMALTAHSAVPSDAWCRSSAITRIRQQTLADSRAPERPAATAVLAADDRLKPPLDLGCLGAAHIGSAGASPLSQDAIAYAWLLIDASMYVVCAGDNAPERQSGGPICIGPIAAITRRRYALPPRLAPQACPSGLGEHSAMCRPLHLAVVQADERQYLVGLSQRILGIQATSRVYVRCSSRAAEHQYLRRVRGRRVFRSASFRRRRRRAGMRHPVFSIYCSPPGVDRAAREHRRNTTRRFSPVDGSALRDPITACTVRSAGVGTGDTHVPPMGEGLDCFGRTANSLIEEMCVARWAAGARQKGTARFSDAIRSMNSRTRSSRYTSIFGLRLVTRARFFECVNLSEDATN